MHIHGAAAGKMSLKIAAARVCDRGRPVETHQCVWSTPLLRTFSSPKGLRNLKRDCDAFDESWRKEMQRPVSLASPSPEPTAPPDANLVAHRLQQRSIASTTCGWVNGDFGTGDPFTEVPLSILEFLRLI
jgi:hypothetical protein